MVSRSDRDESVEMNKIISIGSSNLEANATANVTISNVAPAGVGTATISKWLKVDDNGTTYYIPMWT